MLVLKDTDIGGNFGNWHEQVISGETIIVSSPKKENVIIITEKDYNEMMKAKRNAEYLSKIDKSIENHKKGDTISFTMEELREMEADDWKPTERILEFERKHGIKRNGDIIQ